MDNFDLTFTPENGLTMTWRPANGVVFDRIPVRARVVGYYIFRVWGGDAGEDAPAWADKNLDVTIFGSNSQTVVRQADATASNNVVLSPFRGDAESARQRGMAGQGMVHTATSAVGNVRATLTAAVTAGGVIFTFAVANDRPVGQKHLPVCWAEFSFGGIDIPFRVGGGRGEDPGATWLSAASYGGYTYGYGKLSEIEAPGIGFINGCIGHSLPVFTLHDESANRGIRCEYYIPRRSVVWLRPSESPLPLRRGPGGGSLDLVVSVQPGKLLQSGEAYEFGGDLTLTDYSGPALTQIRAARDAASTRGYVAPFAPEWARYANFVEFNMSADFGNANPKLGNGFLRLDDPKCRDLLARWKEMGYNAIFAVSPNHVGQNALSPFDYAPRDDAGGAAGEAQMLAWAHDLGFKIILWVTTVGIDRDAPDVKAHPDWFTHRRDQSLFYAWGAGPSTGYVSYAPDGDPLSSGWRDWLRNQISDVVGRGYDGVFIDGCIPRPDNHSRWAWPGEGRDAVDDLVADIADHVRSLGPDLITFVEDHSIATQGSCEMTMGRYFATSPTFWTAYNALSVALEPPIATPAVPQNIPPELARDFLLTHYYSVLPGGVINDVLEGYYSEPVRPWNVQSLFGGNVPKTHSQYVVAPDQIVGMALAPQPDAAERDTATRTKGFDEFFNLLRMARDDRLIRDAPLVIEDIDVTGDTAVVGMLRPSPDRCLLAVIQFAPRASTVSVSLGSGRSEFASRAWSARETMRSMVDGAPHPGGAIGAGHALGVTVAPYGFRIFELT